MPTPNLCGKLLLAGFAVLAELAPLGTAHAGFTVLYAFDGRDGDGPYGLIEDAAGNLYGTTYLGGVQIRHTVCSDGCGTVFKLASGGTGTVLYAFPGKNGHGVLPEAGLIEDAAGNLYGTTSEGGTGCCGTVFKLAPDGAETVLYSFPGGSEGADPMAGLIRDKGANLYGTTFAGGDTECMPELGGCGTVFKLAPDGAEAVLHVFTGGSDGANPWAGVIHDKAGNLYGTTYLGGADGLGTVFKVKPDGAETVLHAFTGENGDGSTPGAALIEDKAGNLYGTTELGGTYGDGTVFRLAPDGSETVLHSFAGGRHADGDGPEAGLIEDRAGNLYGTTTFGGNLKGGQCKRYGCGTVFKLAPDGTETVLHAFHGRDGAWPVAGLIMDGAGQLYGTASSGGGTHCPLNTSGCGTVFKLKKWRPR